MASPWAWFLVRDRSVVFDVAATAMPPLVVAGASVALAWARLRRRAELALAAVSSLLVGAAAVLGPQTPNLDGEPVGPLRVVVANASRQNTSPAAATADILGQRGDLVVVVEGGARVAGGLRDDYAFLATRPGGEPLLLSRYPVRALPPPRGLRDAADVTRWSVSTPSGTVVVYAIHLDRPRVRNALLRRLRLQRQVVRVLLDGVEAESSPTLVVGDFNLSDRSWAYRRLSSEMADAMRAGWAGPTYVGGPYQALWLRIDHLFIPRGWCGRASGRFAISGSDHRGVASAVGPCRQEPAGGRALAE